MSHISRIASPMSLCEEDLFDVDKKVKSKIRLLEQQQKEPPATFLVGTIGEVNRRITNLHEELSKYDSHVMFEGDTPQPISRPESTPESFVSAFSLRQPTPSEKRHDIKQKKKPADSASKSSDAPRLVELQQYPGWNPRVCNSLPHSLGTEKVLDHVVSAQYNLHRKPLYRREFCRLLYSDIQEFILQDSFWWFFLEKFHPNMTNQARLFKRIAVNFVSLLLVAESPKFRDLFFAAYGDVLAQSVYSAFCLAFPQSWRQFDEPAFKELLTRVCGEWISGIPPPPQSYENWDYSSLELKGMRKEEVIKKKKKPDQGAKSLSGARGGSSYSSAGSTKTSAMRSPTGSHKANSLPRQATAKSDSSGPSPKLNPRVAELISEHNGTLSTITEEPNTSTTGSVINVPKISAGPLNDTTSCIAGRTTEFSRNVFNIYGRSPLLSQFSELYDFEKKSFYDVLVNLTLVRSLPSKDAPTYRDIINESKKTAASAAKNFQSIYHANMKEHQIFCTKQKQERRTFDNKLKKLLSKPKQTHFLSNLILMEMKNPDEDTNPVGATAAAQAALSAETDD